MGYRDRMGEVAVTEIMGEAILRTGKLVTLNEDGSWAPKRFDSELVPVLGGRFEMGCAGGWDAEKPVRRVQVDDFWIGRFAVTVGEYREFAQDSGRKMPDPPDWGWQDHYPMVNVTWRQSREYCAWLSERKGLNYRLPTEAQWEFAARGGLNGRGYSHSGHACPQMVAWFAENTTEAFACPVGLLMPNELGVHDMSGNVWEWCEDFFAPYDPTDCENPRGPVSAQFRVLRGGAWNKGSFLIRNTHRGWCGEDYGDRYIGFRIVSDGPSPRNCETVD